jgi:RNA polymerase sigma-70 factor (ECF subfamily)|tara:strand:- start:460 stop:1011 length:552 start_codon:yes stop_codon:yes gene_type:complete
MKNSTNSLYPSSISSDDIFACYDMVMRTMMKKCKNPAIAHDSAMNGIVKAIENMDKYNGQSKVSTWVCTVAFRLWLDTIRSHSNSRTTYTGDGTFLEAMGGSYICDFEIESNEDHTTNVVNEALASLSEAHRQVVTMHYMEGMKYREIAERINKPIGTVMSRLNQAKMKLKANGGLLALSETL